MARMNIYLPDDLAAEAKAADLNVSALAQEAIRAELQRTALARWFEDLDKSPPIENPPTREQIIRALDEARDEMGL